MYRLSLVAYATTIYLQKEVNTMSKSNRSTQSEFSNIVVIRNYPASLIHEHVSSDDGSVFKTLSFRFRDAWASLILPEGSVSQSVSRKGKNIDGRQNVLLGDPEQVRNVSILETDGTYRRQPMFAKTILSSITESRQEYLRSIAV